jgi:HEAT repeat protein
LEEISREGKVAISGDTGPGRRLVSIQFQDLPLDEGLRQILRDHDAFFFYGVEGKAPASLRAVWVYPKGQGRGLEPVPPEAWASTRELEAELADPNPKARARAIEALVERKGDGARDAVLEALKDHDEEVRAQALYQTVSGDVELPTDALTDLALGDPSPAVRFLALEALTDRPEARTIAETALNDPSPQIRHKAQEILRELDAATRPRKPSQPAQDRSLPQDRR